MFRLQDQLLELFKDQGGGVILFTWLSFLQEDLLAFLGMETEINTSDLVDVLEPDERLDESETMEQLSLHESARREENGGETSAKRLPEFPSKSLLTGTVKKWKQEGDRSGHGYIRAESREWSFNIRDCIIEPQQYDRSLLFSKGDRVCFEEMTNSARKAARAVNVRLFDGSDVEELSDDHCKDVDAQNGATAKVANCDKIDVENTLSVRRTNDVGIVKKRTSKQKQIITLLREFNQMKKDEKFSVSLHSCDICFTDKVWSDVLCLLSVTVLPAGRLPVCPVPRV